MNSSYPGANRGPGLIGNYPRPMPYNNGQQNWPTRYPNDQHPQQRQEFFDRPNFSIQPDNNNNNNHNNGFYGSRPTHPMPNGNNYNRQMNYNEMNERTFNHHQQNFVRPMTQVCLSYFFVSHNKIQFLNPVCASGLPPRTTTQSCLSKQQFLPKSTRQSNELSKSQSTIFPITCQ